MGYARNPSYLPKATPFLTLSDYIQLRLEDAFGRDRELLASSP